MPPSADPARRAVVTGMGAVMPIGNDFETYWRNLRDGVSGVRRITAFDPADFEVKIAAEVKDFRAADHMDAKMARRMSRFIHLAMAAAKEALGSAGLDPAALHQDAPTGSAWSSTPAEAGSSRSSRVRTSGENAARGSSRRSPSRPSPARWAPAC